MTHDEMRQVKAQLLLDTVEAEQTLTALYSQLHKIIDGLDELLKKIRGTSQPTVEDKWLRDLFDADKLLTLTREIRETDTRVKDLRERKKGLGLP